jgi:hypothetical protein
VAYSLSSRSSSRALMVKSRNRARSTWYRAFARFGSQPCITVLPAESLTRHSHPRPRFEIAISNIRGFSLFQVRKVQAKLK